MVKKSDGTMGMNLLECGGIHYPFWPGYVILSAQQYNESEVSMSIRLSQKGWVVIPAFLREKHGLKPGSEVHVVDYGGVLSIVPVPADPIAAGLGLLQGEDSLTAFIAAEHRQEREHE